MLARLLVKYLVLKISAEHSLTTFVPPLHRTECYDYLFDIAVRMKQMGLDPEMAPKSETEVNGKMGVDLKRAPNAETRVNGK